MIVQGKILADEGIIVANLLDQLEFWAERRPGQVVYTFRGEDGSQHSLTYERLAREALVEVVQRRIPRVESAVGTIRAVHETSVASKLLARVEDAGCDAAVHAEADVIGIGVAEAAAAPMVLGSPRVCPCTGDRSRRL